MLSACKEMSPSSPVCEETWSSSFFFFLFCLFRASPKAHGGSQARGGIRAVAASLHRSHSNAISGLCLQLTPQLTAMPDP